MIALELLPEDLPAPRGGTPGAELQKLFHKAKAMGLGGEQKRV